MYPMVNSRTQTVTLHLLGTFEATIDATTVSAFPTDKIRALLAYLALETHAEGSHVYRREYLAGLLWPDMPDALALTNLRLALHRLRQTLDRAQSGAGEALIVVTRHTLHVHKAALHVDVLDFQSLLAHCAAHQHADLATCEECIARLMQAVELYRGELLAGFGIADALAFEEWLLLRREMLHQQAIAALHSLTIIYEQRGDYYQSHIYASRQLALDPYREEAHRQLMRMLAHRGLFSEALAQFETCRRLLHHELGVEPDAETIALAAAIRNEEANGTSSHTSFVPTEVSSATHSSLPAPLMPLQGREEELARISTLLQDTSTRLITIMGVGGVGKTRLALAVAWALQETSADGAVWISLASIAPVNDAEQQINTLAAAVGAAMGMSFHGRSEPFEMLRLHLETRTLLMVLDNCEHLTITAFVHKLLATAPRLRVLATSRIRLSIEGEVLVRLEGLPVPERDSDAPDSYAGIQLFVAHARQHMPDFGSDPADLATVARLCRLLEGLPLGIELAARWVGHYTCDEITNEIQADIDFLSLQRSDAPERHRSLRAVFSYSWAMLRDAERQALARLAIFSSSFDRAAAQAIAETRVTTLAALVDASLLRHLGVGRYGFHELVRQFAAAQLAATGEFATIAQRHATYYMELLARQETLLYGSKPDVGSVIVRDAADHIRQAWVWALEHSAWDLIARSLPALRQYTRIDGLFHEHTLRIAATAERLEEQLAQDVATAEQRILLGRLRSTLAYFLERQERRTEATTAARTAIALATTMGDSIGEAFAYLRLSCATIAFVAVLSPLETAPVIEWLQRAIELCHAAQPTDPLERRFVIEIEAESLLYLTTISIKLGNYATACTFPKEALALARANGDRIQENRALNFYAEALDNAGQYEEALEQRTAMLALARTNNSRMEVFVALNNLSCTLIYLGDYRQALEHARAALDILRTQPQNPYDLANTYHTISWAACRTGETVFALETAQQALALVQPTGVSQYQALPLLALGDALHDMGRYTEAYQTYAAALALGRTHEMSSLVAVARSDMARCRLAEGIHAEAQALIDELLHDQDIFSLGSLWEPLRIAEVCYRVLKASDDERATIILQAAAAKLNLQATAISHPERRRTFCEAIVAHHFILYTASISIPHSLPA